MRIAPVGQRFIIQFLSSSFWLCSAPHGGAWLIPARSTSLEVELAQVGQAWSEPVWLPFHLGWSRLDPAGPSLCHAVNLRPIMPGGSESRLNLEKCDFACK